MKTGNLSPGWRRLFARWLPMLLWMAVIFVVSHRPSSDLPVFGFWDVWVKKSGHFLAYAVLAVLAHRVTAHTKRPYVWALFITAAYAVSDEFHQTFVAGRNGNLVDVLIDCAGGIAGLYMLRGGFTAIENLVKRSVKEAKEYRIPGDY